MQLAALIAQAREVTAEQARAAEVAARLGQTAVLAAVAAEAAGFASGKPLDVAPGGAALGLFLEDAADADDRYAGASDDEMLG